MTVVKNLQIVDMGKDGDGIAVNNGKRCFVHYAATGDEVAATIYKTTADADYAKINQVINPSSLRQNPCCPYFTQCGGCKLQHLKDDAYKTFKTSLITKTLDDLKISGYELFDIFVVPPKSRRRATFTARKSKNVVALGFNAQKSENVIDIANCPILTTNIEKLILPLKTLAEKILANNEQIDIFIADINGALELVFLNLPRLTLDINFDITEFAQNNHITKVGYQLLKAKHIEPLLIKNEIYKKFANYSIKLPFMPFLQATNESELYLQGLVSKHLQEAKHVADLFAGFGTFALLALEHAQSVDAFESTVESSLLLNSLAKQFGLSSRLAAYQRDLMHDPLTSVELKKYDTIIMDPPRIGAKAQVEEIVNAKTPKIISVSCNISSFARDAFILTSNGYKLTHVYPVDQFLYSNHVEVVGIFSLS